MTKAYRFQRYMYHARCIAKATHSRLYQGNLRPNMPADVYLDRAARFRKIDRENESTFTDDEFPKRMFDDEITAKMVCAYCRKPLP